MQVGLNQVISELRTAIKAAKKDKVGISISVPYAEALLKLLLKSRKTETVLTRLSGNFRPERKRARR